MRDQFSEQLQAVFDDLAAICRQVETAVTDATQALMTGDVTVAEQVISADAEIDRARERAALVRGTLSTTLEDGRAEAQASLPLVAAV